MKTLYENTILIVDDSPEIIDIIVDILEDFNTKISISGEDALEIIFKDEPPDLILLDVIMPKMNGFEVCRQLRANPQTMEIPIIFLTIKTLKDDIVHGFEAGGQDYITKPFDGRELIERIKTHLELKAQREILRNVNVILEEKVLKRTEELKNALEKLDDANKELQGLDTAKNNFLMMISHEIRTPLNGIVGASSFLKDTLNEDSELSIFVDMLNISVERLEKFSTTALLITQLQAKYKFPRETINIAELAEYCIKYNEESSKEKNIGIVKNIDNYEINIEANKGLIEYAINSIINNSIKYSKEGDIVLLKIYTKGTEKIIEVNDNGRGFTQTAIENLFKPFSVGEPHYDDNVGLSLKAAKHIMEAHGGEIKAKNFLQSGASVSLIFK
ncbi:MAG: hybrid sensor histidine kinase/response regulator [Bacteroidetes bacterium]|jgi:two-component system, sensor histidine kinase and response regulator|nr:hybrid sensor histidine kinase/response regulator [Bacteroidota bacterium]MBT6687203.1 hybrid sensor histidine kinase/response regulator [Bacteroidota bacterium]MBT7144568.1 hybrid sensor histidine kinase/response regulator [Bacteroidota bacterium]MBT7490768.1 hybrid sensor histidine kinase/response regulator [Bacteroidota bacterium]